jgi:hypothetical protein
MCKPRRRPKSAAHHQQSAVGATPDSIRSEVINAWQAGRPLSDIATNTGLRPRTVRRWVHEWIDARLP